MKTIFKTEVIANEPNNEQIWAEYTLEDQREFMYISYDHFITFINRNDVPELKVEGMQINVSKVDAGDIQRLSDEVFYGLVEKFLRNHHRVDLIIENQELKAENARLRTQVNMARVQLKVIDVHKDYFKQMLKSTERLPKPVDSENLIIVLTLKNTLEKVCYEAIQCFNEDKNWIKERVLMESDLPSENRKSA